MHVCRWGITHTLDQVFEAEPIIKHVMNDESGITRAFVATACAPALPHAVPPHTQDLRTACLQAMLCWLAHSKHARPVPTPAYACSLMQCVCGPEHLTDSHAPACRNRQADAERLLRECAQVRNLYTPESSYRVRLSAYNATARSQQVLAVATTSVTP